MKKCEEMNVLLLLPVVLVAAVVVVAPVGLAALADGLGLHALAQDRRLLLLGGVLGGVRRGHEVPAAQGRIEGMVKKWTLGCVNFRGSQDTNASQ